MKVRKFRFGACHYCVCTACTRFNCPFKHKLYRECYACRESGSNSPRLECDYFEHYLKSHTFRFRRAVQPLSKHFGTYILITREAVSIGSYEELLKLSERLGGVPKKLNIIDHNFGGD